LLKRILFFRYKYLKNYIFIYLYITNMPFYISKIKNSFIDSSNVNVKSFHIKQPSSNAMTINPPESDQPKRATGNNFSVYYPSDNALSTNTLDEIISIIIGDDPPSSPSPPPVLGPPVLGPPVVEPPIFGPPTPPTLPPLEPVQNEFGTGQVQWITNIKGEHKDNQYSNNMEVDESNSLYISGRARNEVIDIYSASDSGPTGELGQEFNMVGSTAVALENYIVKYYENGEVHWLTKIGGQPTSEIPINMAVGNGGLYISGQSVDVGNGGNAPATLYVYSADINDAPTGTLGDVYEMTMDASSNNTADNYIVKYGADDGQVKWLTKIGSDNSNDRPINMVLDNNNGLYISGETDNQVLNVYSADINDTPTGTLGNKYEMTMEPELFRADNYIVKYGADDGQVQWLTKIGSDNSDDIPVNMVSDNTNGLYISGNTKSTVLNVYSADINGTPTGTLGNKYEMDGLTGDSNYIVKYGSGDGQVDWLTRIVADRLQPDQMRVDNKGSVYVCGSSINQEEEVNTIYVYSAYTGPTAGPTGSKGDEYKMEGNTGFDNYIVKYGADDGQVKWVSKIGGKGDAIPSDMIIDNNDGIYIVGRYIGELDIYSASTTGPTGALGDKYEIEYNNIPGAFDNYVVKYGADDGQVKWISKLESKFSEPEYRMHLQLDSTNGLYIYGDSLCETVNVYSASYIRGPTGNLGDLYQMEGSTGANQNYIIKYDTDNGQVKWLTTIRGDNDVYTSNMRIDNDDDLYISGYAKDTLAIEINSASSDGNGPTGTVGPSYQLNGVGAYIAKYNTKFVNFVIT
jgi:hypothetical protein